MRTVELSLGPRPREPIPHRIGAGALESLAELPGRPARLLLVTERNVAATPWPGRAEAALSRSGLGVDRFVVEPGEANKRLAAVEALWREWLSLGAGRDAMVVAVGGGVLTDMAGFAAAAYMRGLAWVAVPTTVLGIADASVGGKTAVNTEQGKNLIGAFHHPACVVADLDCLSTLPERHYVEGWAEVVKAGAIGDLGLLELIENEGERIRAREPELLEELLARAVAVKVEVVAADEREAGQRAILNFGHTVAHALEQVTDHALSHGAAVAVGMVVEARVGVDLGHSSPEMPGRLKKVCEQVGLKTSPPRGLAPVRLLAALGVDKKRKAGRSVLSLPSRLGVSDLASPTVEVAVQDLLDMLGD